MEKTLVLIKPDAVRGKHIGDIVKIYEEKGLKILAMKMLQMDEKLASKHYEEHIGRPYYDDLMGFMTSGPIIAMVLEGEGAIANVRAIKGTIRKLYAASGSRNAVHASDSPENAAREISIFFNASEIFD